MLRHLAVLGLVAASCGGPQAGSGGSEESGTSSEGDSGGETESTGVADINADLGDEPAVPTCPLADAVEESLDTYSTRLDGYADRLVWSGTGGYRTWRPGEASSVASEIETTSSTSDFNSTHLFQLEGTDRVVRTDFETKERVDLPTSGEQIAGLVASERYVWWGYVESLARWDNETETLGEIEVWGSGVGHSFRGRGKHAAWENTLGTFYTADGEPPQNIAPQMLIAGVDFYEDTVVLLRSYPPHIQLYEPGGTLESLADLGIDYEPRRPNCLVTEGSDAYWCAEHYPNVEILKTDLSTGDTCVLVVTEPIIDSLAVAGGRLYWNEPGEKIYSVGI